MTGLAFRRKRALLKSQELMKKGLSVTAESPSFYRTKAALIIQQYTA